MQPPLTVVISRGRSPHPEKRRFEDELAAELARQTNLPVLVTPPLTDLGANGPVWARLRRTERDLVVLSWLFPRAMHWLLDRHGVAGQRATVGDQEAAEDQGPPQIGAVEPVAAGRPLPDRRIHCGKLDTEPRVSDWVDRVRGIAEIAASLGEPLPASSQPQQLEEPPRRRRWFPVIDYSRCTNCMECIDFCLFGVYGIDAGEIILVEQPDLCRPGCPACSRVCPENAILFPHHPTPAIAGACGETGGLKVDLSALFGGSPTADRQAAARERESHRPAAEERSATNGPVDPRVSEAARSPGPDTDDWFRQLEEI